MNHHILDTEDNEDDVDDVFPVLAAGQHEPENIGSLGMTSKIPPSFDGRTSWFQYEELIDDWLDLTTLDPDKHGPALKNRLSGDAIIYKQLMQRNLLKDPNQGVKHFKAVLRPHYVKGTQSVCLWRFFQFMRTHRGNTEFIKWIGRIWSEPQASDGVMDGSDAGTSTQRP